MPDPGSAAGPSPRPTPRAGAPFDRPAALAGGLLLALAVALGGALLALVLAGPGGRPGGPAGAGATEDPFLLVAPIPAPALELVDQEGRPFSLASLRGRPVLVFFGYTHCPDVCPETVGTVNRVLADVGDGPRAVFVSIDPERDDVAAMASYLRYLPAAYVGLSGSPQEVRRSAEAWGVQYARIDEGAASGYAMAHTADLFLVDGEGMLRARFPFGTPPEPIAERLRTVTAEVSSSPPAPSTAAVPPTAAASSTAEAAPTPGTPSTSDLRATLVSTAIWAGGASPVILRLEDAAGRPLDGALPLQVVVRDAAGTQVGPEVVAVAVRPPGEERTSFVVTLDLPAPGTWGLDLTAGSGRGRITVTALDPGASAPLGRPFPRLDPPTLDQVGGNLLAISTLRGADPRLYRESPAQAMAAGRALVVVLDSARFTVSPACGKALGMIRYQLDRWPGVAFAHLEPFDYQIVTGEPVLSGTLEAPALNRWSRALGLGDATWPGTAMPWIFVVDGRGILRAKATGIVGSADVDVIVSLVTGTGIVHPAG